MKTTYQQLAERVAAGKTLTKSVLVRVVGNGYTIEPGDGHGACLLDDMRVVEGHDPVALGREIAAMTGTGPALKKRAG